MQTQKFTDQQLLDLHKLGYTDTNIAPILNVSRTTIEKRRWKLNLLPNFSPTYPTLRYNTIIDGHKHRIETAKQELDYYVFTHPTWRHDYYQRNLDKFHKSQRKYRGNHKEICRQRTKLWRQTHKEQRRKYQQQYNQEHKEQQKQWRQEHKEQIKRTAKQYRQKRKKLN